MARQVDKLGKWKQASQSTINDPATLSPLGKKLYSAAENGEVVKIIYLGGTSAGASRDITPVCLFRKSQYGSIYVTAYCHTRNEDRTFRLDRIELPSGTGESERSSAVPVVKNNYEAESGGKGCLSFLLLLAILAIMRDFF